MCIDLFNNEFSKLLNFCSKFNRNKINYIKVKMATARLIDIYYIWKVSYPLLKKFEDKIKEKDYEYFAKMDYTQYTKNAEVLEIINLIKDLYEKKLNDEDKEIISNIILEIIKLGDSIKSNNTIKPF